MIKGEVELKLEKLRITFFASPTKGLVFYENLLLPKDDHGQNEEGYENLRKAFANSNDKQQKLAEDTIDILKSLRNAALTSKEAKKIIQKYRDQVLDEVATYRVIAENSKE